MRGSAAPRLGSSVWVASWLGPRDDTARCRVVFHLAVNRAVIALRRGLARRTGLIGGEGEQARPVAAVRRARLAIALDLLRLLAPHDAVADALEQSAPSHRVADQTPEESPATSGGRHCVTERRYRHALPRGKK